MRRPTALLVIPPAPFMRRDEEERPLRATNATTMSLFALLTCLACSSDGITLAEPAVPAVPVAATAPSCTAPAGAGLSARVGETPTADGPVLNVTLGVVPDDAGTGTASDVALVLCRFDGGSGTVAVTSGIPLQPGALRPGQEGQVRLFVGSTEQAVHVAALEGRHLDGSLRAVLVQFQYAVPTGSGVSARLTLGSPRPSAATLASALVADAQRSVPAAVALPSGVDYLLATDLVGPALSVAETRALGGDFQRYETDFVTFADRHWSSRGDDWTENYYDRAQIYYAWWVRSGNPEYWHRATRLAVSYRKSYLEPNNYGSSPHWAQLEGLVTHYLLTGDGMSRKAVGGVAEVLYGGFHNNTRYLGRTDGSNFESRIVARVVLAELLAARIGAPLRSGASVDWAARLDDAVNKVVQTQGADGAFRYAYICGATLNYMDGMLADVLIEVHRTYRADSRIPGLLKRLADYQWTTQWLADKRAFKYVSKECTTTDGLHVGGPTPAPDLNNMMVNLQAWVHQHTGDAQYRQRADAIFSGGVQQAFLYGSKQFNEHYGRSYHFLKYRQ